jgi:hypothetical protein
MIIVKKASDLIHFYQLLRARTQGAKKKVEEQ